jgi:hypothetical protein
VFRCRVCDRGLVCMVEAVGRRVWGSGRSVSRLHIRDDATKNTVQGGAARAEKKHAGTWSEPITVASLPLAPPPPPTASARARDRLDPFHPILRRPIHPLPATCDKEFGVDPRARAMPPVCPRPAANAFAQDYVIVCSKSQRSRPTFVTLFFSPKG